MKSSGNERRIDTRRIILFSERFKGTRLCPEEESLIRYRYDPENPYAERLLRYRNPEENYPRGVFRERTNGMGLTRSFRACLAKYLKEIKQENGSPPRYDSPELNDFLCYLNVVGFWDRFEEIRNLNYVRRPLIIESKKVAAELLRGGALRDRCAKLGRQLILDV